MIYCKHFCKCHTYPQYNNNIINKYKNEILRSKKYIFQGTPRNQNNLEKEQIWLSYILPDLKLTTKLQ
jgi:hypothetical protein